MLQLIPVIDDISNDPAAQWAWDILAEQYRDSTGLGYYRHPSIGTGRGALPDLALYVDGVGAFVVKTIPTELASITALDDDTWIVDGIETTRPDLELSDLQVTLDFRFKSDRRLRNKLPVYRLLACPHITQHNLTEAFPACREFDYSLWLDRQSWALPLPGSLPQDETERRLAKSIFQTASILSQPGATLAKSTDNLGRAIRSLERQIALLDEQQTKAAFQVPPGPQRIRGLAGTGKTVLLARKAATIHSHQPDAKILFTFNTQSLYNQTRDLISNFYRMDKGVEPDWTVLHLRHGWGGRWQAGVYSDLAARQGARPLTFTEARLQSPDLPFRACCAAALQNPIREEYDYVLIDEAQDFPPEFFQLIYKITKQPKCIYFAFDELQSLSSVEIPTAEDLFGRDEQGGPVVNLEGTYENGMEKDVVLYKSYRCPNDVLMLAHGLGLGIKNSGGCVQMISRESTWQAIGYEVERGPLMTGTSVRITRPKDHSPNRIRELYHGDRPLIRTYRFADRQAELEAVADFVIQDIHEAKIPPEKIVVISLDSIPAKKYLAEIQRRLLKAGVASVIPGLVDDASDFAEAGRITLSTVHRAKGNEAPMIYILAFDSLYSYVREVEMRNRAFTCISRSKAFVTITGIGKAMDAAIHEINGICKDIPSFEFRFPDMRTIERNLDVAETVRRRDQVRSAKKSLANLQGIDAAALKEMDPQLLAELQQKIDEAMRLRGDD